MRAAAVVVASLAGLAACAHTPDLPLRPDPAPPIGSTTEVITAPDGTLLLARHWAPIDAPRAVVVIMHGLKDHSARYAAFATRLAGAGYSVYAFDLRGHGRSSGKRAAPGRWSLYVDDLDRFLANLETREPGRPVFVLGHSMGGAIAAAAAIRHQPPIAGLILSAPALVVDASPLLLAVTRMASALSPRAPVLALPNADFSSAPGAKEAMDEDPLISQSAGPARTAGGLIDGMSEIWGNASHLTMPLLALHGTRDRLTAPAGSRMLIEAAPGGDHTLRIYDGMFHDLLHEPDHARVEADIVAWLDAHTGGAAIDAPPAVYRGHLAGDPRGWTQAISIGAGVVLADDEVRFAGDVTIQLARPRPFGWHGMVGGRWIGAYRAATLAPAGVALRFGGRAIGGVVGIATGGALLSGTPHLAIPATAWLELSFGPSHVSAGAELMYRVGGDPARDGPLSSDVAWAGLALRFGGDRLYGPHTSAGVGPYAAGGVTEVAGVRAWTLTIGLQLYGAD